MHHDTSRRSFLRKSLAATVAAPMVTSLEEFTLTARAADAPAPTPPPKPMPTGKIGKLQISRLICGGNLISGYAHSRDLIYVSNLLKAYFTEEKIMETWDVCYQNGINTMIFAPSDKRALEIYRKYRTRNGKMQCFAQVTPDKDNLDPAINEAADAGVDGMVLVGNYGDEWSRAGAVDRIGKFVEKARAKGVVAGVGGHELRTPMTVEKAGIAPDFYMKTLHSTGYWSKRRPDQVKEVIDNYGVDNYWCMDPEGTIRFMAEMERPWIAYKVLAAGAIPPKAGFQYAFENGADFCVVGMFDFQVAENAGIAAEVVKATQNRERAWMA